MAGYSGTPLPQKLGVKPGSRVALANAPDSASAVVKEVGSVGEACTGLAGKQPFDVIVQFVTSQRDLAARFDKAAAKLAETGGLWIAWPKKSSGVETDLNENLIRDVGLAAGLVDNKVCAIDETWSGLRFVVRVKDRKGKGRA
jgi:hypothetical protein